MAALVIGSAMVLATSAPPEASKHSIGRDDTYGEPRLGANRKERRAMMDKKAEKKARRINRMNRK